MGKKETYGNQGLEMSMEQGNRKGVALVFPVVTGLGITVLLPHGSVL